MSRWQPSDSQETPDELLALLGEMLLLIQDFEGLLAFVVDAVVEGDKQLARDNLLRAEPRTIGKLLTLLRRKAALTSSFDTLLASTLKGRNVFIHELQKQHDLSSIEGRRSLLRFMDSFQLNLISTTDVLKALILAYGRALGVADEALEREWRTHGDLDRLERVYLPHLSQYLGRQRSSPDGGPGAAEHT